MPLQSRLTPIKHFLLQLGLDKRSATLYLTLLKKGPQTLAELAQAAAIPRTTIYRIIEDMKQAGTVEEIVDQYKQKVQAVAPDKLKMLIVDQKLKVGLLEAQFPKMLQGLEALAQDSQARTKVLYYRGKEGIKQMIWNVLNAQGEVVGYDFRTIEEVVGTRFTKRWVTEFIEHGLKFRTLYSDEYLKSVKGDLRAAISATPGQTEKFIDRYIPPNILDIDHQVDIYNDVYAMYRWYRGEVFGVEIHNEKIAKMQKQIFEVLWRMGKSKP